MTFSNRTRKWCFRICLILLCIIFIPYICSRAFSTWHRLSSHSIQNSENKRDWEKSTIRVACYNIAHGRGLAESNWDGGNKKQRLKRIDQIAKKLNEVNADIVVLNEVDFNASWSNSLNQAMYLAKKADYTYWLEQRNLDFRILGWTWKFGNSVLSRYPIERERLINLPAYSRLETILAGKKRAVSCDINIDGRRVRIIAAHLSHRSEHIRVKSAELITKLSSESDIPLILVGDLNSTPSGFPRSLKDKNGNNAIDILDQSGLFKRYPDQTMLSLNNFTYSSIEPVSIIDWIFIPKNYSFAKYKVEGSELSDHRLIYADIIIRSSTK